jgi:hypothetical protein
MLLAFPRLGEGCRLKEVFNTFWELEDMEEALAFLSYWCDWVQNTDIKPFKEFVKTVKSHWSGDSKLHKSKNKFWGNGRDKQQDTTCKKEGKGLSKY